MAANKKESWIKRMASNPNFSKAGSVLQDFVDGNILVRKNIRNQYVLILMVVGFCIIYIGNRYTCDKAMREQRELTKEVEDLRLVLMSVSAEVTEKTRGSVIEDSVRNQLPNLKVSKIPIINIK